MKLTALVGQVDVKFDLSKETETGGRETQRARERDRQKEDLNPRLWIVWPVTWGGRMKKIHNSANMRGLETV